MSNPCPQCCGQTMICKNCTFAQRTGSMVFDLGVGGWTDDPCFYCDQVAGEWTVPRTDICMWMYVENWPCGIGSLLQLDSQIDYGGSTSNWRWEFEVKITWSGYSNASAIYHSASSTEADCWALGGNSTDNKLTLTKQSDTAGSTGVMCDGALPSTITAWQA